MSEAVTADSQASPSRTVRAPRLTLEACAWVLAACFGLAALGFGPALKGISPQLAVDAVAYRQLPEFLAGTDPWGRDWEWRSYDLDDPSLYAVGLRSVHSPGKVGLYSPGPPGRESSGFYPRSQGYWTLALAWASDTSLLFAGLAIWLLPWIRLRRSTRLRVELGRALAVSLPLAAGVLCLLFFLARLIEQEEYGVFAGGPPARWCVAVGAPVFVALLSACVLLRLSRPAARSESPAERRRAGWGIVWGAAGAVAGSAAALAIATIGGVVWCRGTGTGGADPGWLVALDELTLVSTELSVAGAALTLTTLALVGVFRLSESIVPRPCHDEVG